MKLYSLAIALVLSGCMPDVIIKFDEKDTGSDDTDTGSDSDSDTDTNETSETGETGETGDTADTADSGDTGLIDSDGDGATDDIDCDDANASVYPGATEVCNELDDNCDGTVDEGLATNWYADFDGDGYGDSASSVSNCAQPSGYVSDATDCDDYDADFHPGADESDCTDPNDYNCDGSGGLDDIDADGFAACEECDDSDANINPDAAEVCNEVDDDCNGDVDEDDAGVTDASTLYVDGDGDGYGTGSVVVTCDSMGYSAVDGDCDDSEASAYPSAVEVCDSADIDENCDGVAEAEDSAGVTVWHSDDDGDGYGDADDTVTQCDAPSGYITTASGDEDCDDSDASINVAATETCSTLYDDNCDSSDDNSAFDATTWYHDVDSDGFGDSTDTKTSCVPDSGYISDDTDCNDSNSRINPDADETCDGGYIDEDCDGLIDDDDSSVADPGTFYRDADSDGYGDSSATATSCEQPAGYSSTDGDCDDGYSDAYPGNIEWCDGIDNDCSGAADDGDDDGDGYNVCDDCDESNPDANPGATEMCDGVDNDCDSSVDEDSAADAITWYADSDGDGYGYGASSDVDCDQPSGYVEDGDDCNDSNSGIYPGATEVIADGVDQDCDGYETCLNDGDDDGYLDGLGDTLASVDGDCSDTNEGTTSDPTTDCDDARAEINPGESENPTTVWDDDCDGFAHDDGTVYAGSIESGAPRGTPPAAASITFTGANWIGDVVGDLSADSLFESATALGTAGASGTTVWEVMEDSTSTFSTASFTVNNTTWSSTLSGTYPGLQVLRGTSTYSVCTGVEFTGLVSGDKYGFAADFRNSDASAVTIVLETGLGYTLYGGSNPMVEVSLSASTDRQLIGGFVADSGTEQIYVCARPTAGTLSLAHAWFSEASW